MSNMETSEETKQEPEHKPMPVHGYTAQKDANINLVNRNKIIEESILLILDELFNNPDTDKRWLAIGRTHIEEGFMAINRGIFKPNRLNTKSLGVEEPSQDGQTKANTDKPGSV